jgi:L-amino acid N-acyltransferase YncA
MHSAATPQIVVDLMTCADWPSVREIYLEGIRTGNATFETQAPEWDRWDASHLKSCRFVALARNGAPHVAPANSEPREVLGWAGLSPVSSRCVYAGVDEVSVYIAERARGRKIGSVLLAALVDASEREGIWTLQAGIFPENVASVELHKRFGFRVVGTRERIGQMNGRWRDTVLLERRSRIVGV